MAKETKTKQGPPRRKTTPKGAEQVRRRAKYHDNDGETVGSADNPRTRFGDRSKLPQGGDPPDEDR